MTKKSILVISDDPKLKGLLSGGLTEKEFAIRSTEKALEDELEKTLDEELPDLIILDILMPWMDGIELCLRIRQRCPSPIIMLSTWGAKKDMVRGLDLAAEGYLTEPFNIDGLKERIDGALYRN